VKKEKGTTGKKQKKKRGPKSTQAQERIPGQGEQPSRSAGKGEKKKKKQKRKKKRSREK